MHIEGKVEEDYVFCQILNGEDPFNFPRFTLIGMAV